MLFYVCSSSYHLQQNMINNSASCLLTLCKILTTTTDTTRPIHPGEVNGHTYHFVTREEFELDILQERFLEHEEVKGHLYGISVSAIKKILESGRVPVLDLQPQVSFGVRFDVNWFPCFANTHTHTLVLSTLPHVYTSLSPNIYPNSSPSRESATLVSCRMWCLWPLLGWSDS